MTFSTDPPLISDLSLIPGTDEKADLDAPSNTGGKLVVAQVPNISISSTTVVADETERLGLDVQEGDLAIQSDNATSFIFTGGDNVAANWQEVQFDAVGAIDGEDINPRDITPRDITASGDISLQDLTVAGAINGADTSAATAGEALTSDGSGSLAFASVGGVNVVSEPTDLPAPNVGDLAYVDSYGIYYGASYTGGSVELATETATFGLADNQCRDIEFSTDGTLFLVPDVGTDHNIYQCNTPFDMSTAFFSGRRGMIDPDSSGISGVTFSEDGTRFFEMERSTTTGHAQADLTTPFDINTATNIQNFSLNVSANTIEFTPDGTEVFHSYGDVDRYTLSTPYDMTTASFAETYTLPTGIVHMDFFNNGYSILGQAGAGFVSYKLENQYDLDNVFQESKLQVDKNIERATTVNPDGTKIYMASQGPEVVTQWSIPEKSWVPLTNNDPNTTAIQ